MLIEKPDTSELVATAPFNTKATAIENKIPNINLIQDGHFRGCSQIGGVKKASLLKIFDTYPTIMKLGTIIPYVKKIQELYESRDTPLEFC